MQFGQRTPGQFLGNDVNIERQGRCVASAPTETTCNFTYRAHPPAAMCGYCSGMNSTFDPAVTVWYDSACPLCIREIALMRRLDRRDAIDFVDARSAQGCPIDQQELLARFHARERGGPIVSGAAAFAAMWRAIPVLRPLGLLARFRPVLWVLERLYRLFLRVRPAMQRWARRALDG